MCGLPTPEPMSRSPVGGWVTGDDGSLAVSGVGWGDAFVLLSLRRNRGPQGHTARRRKSRCQPGQMPLLQEGFSTSGNNVLHPQAQHFADVGRQGRRGRAACQLPREALESSPEHGLAGQHHTATRARLPGEPGGSELSTRGARPRAHRPRLSLRGHKEGAGRRRGRGGALGWRPPGRAGRSRL